MSAIEECIKLNPTKKIVLFGCSRGAATTVVTLSNLSKDALGHIKLVIVEAPFDSVESVVNESSWFPSPTLYFIENFTKYDKNQQSPLDSVSSDKFPLDIPIAFVMSKVDTRVPIKNTQNLINVLKNKNHTKLHQLILENSHHALMHSHNKEDQNSYINFVNELYETYLR